jgi:hypothetical protein
LPRGVLREGVKRIKPRSAARSKEEFAMTSRFAVICSATVFVALAGISSSNAGMRTELTPEEHAIYAQDEHGTNWHSLSAAQRCARAQQIHAEWRSMTPAAKEQLKQQLDARWNSLPVAQKQRVEQRIAFRRTQGIGGNGGMGAPRCASMAAPH